MAVGSTALFVPPFQVYDLFRQAVLNQKPWEEVHNSAYFTCWSFSKPPGYHRQELADDEAPIAVAEQDPNPVLIVVGNGEVPPVPAEASRLVPT